MRHFDHVFVSMSTISSAYISRNDIRLLYRGGSHDMVNMYVFWEDGGIWVLESPAQWWRIHDQIGKGFTNTTWWWAVLIRLKKVKLNVEILMEFDLKVCLYVLHSSHDSKEPLHYSSPGYKSLFCHLPSHALSTSTIWLLSLIRTTSNSNPKSAQSSLIVTRMVESWCSSSQGVARTWWWLLGLVWSFWHSSIIHLLASSGELVRWW
jgi:hypothetical protein